MPLLTVLTFQLIIRNYFELYNHSLKNKESNNKWSLLSVWGIGLFVLLYIVAAFLYPGGSDANKKATGFSWLHNYWCELMASHAQNGEINTARPVAITAMLVLVISLITFWYRIPFLFNGNKTGSLFIRYCGISSMLIVPFMFAGRHDMVMNVAGLLGCMAITILVIKLRANKMYRLFAHGILCIILCSINNYIYYTGNFFYYLPVIQKITFLIFLLWFTLLSVKISTAATRQ